MADFKVTDGMVEAAEAVFYEDLSGSSRTAISAALAHPDFRKQVAALMRGMVPTEGVPDEWVADGPDERSWDLGYGSCRNGALARIQQWEEGA